MPSITPTAAAPTGAEELALNVVGKGGTVTLAQLKAWVASTAIGSGAANPPVGLPAVAALAGTEQLQLFQNGAAFIATLDQVKAFSLGTQIPALALPAGGAGMAGNAAGALASADQVLLRQAGGLKAMTLAQIATWLTA